MLLYLVMERPDLVPLDQRERRLEQREQLVSLRELVLPDRPIRPDPQEVPIRPLSSLERLEWLLEWRPLPGTSDSPEFEFGC